MGCNCNGKLTGTPNRSRKQSPRLESSPSLRLNIKLCLADLCLGAIDIGDSRQPGIVAPLGRIEAGLKILQRFASCAHQLLEAKYPVVRLFDLERDVLQRAVCARFAASSRYSVASSCRADPLPKSKST